MDTILLCLDSGTTNVKAAAFDGQGRMLTSVERPNGALRREGVRVEQDMNISRDDAMAVLRDCAQQVTGNIAGLVVTGQGDGLWPVDKAGQPVGAALTWLDGRARHLAAGMAPELDAVQAITGSRPTAASASLQLLWLQTHEPERFARIAHALRLKEWLFLSLTGHMLAEPTVALPVWGDWRSGAMAPSIMPLLGLSSDLSLLPELAPIGACRAGMSAAAARATGLPENLPVLLGPGDVQATLIGLGLGTRPEVTRASVFGTSAIHACLRDDPEGMPERPAGAMVQRFALGEGYLCFHPAFNGGVALHHLKRSFADLPERAPPEYSALILHPFLEAGGERAPWTNSNASGALFGLTSATTPGQIAWAGREALAFVTRASHSMMGAADGMLSLGGGLAEDDAFAQFLATVTGFPVRRSSDGHAGLRGLAAIGARFLLNASSAQIAENWIGAGTRTLQPQTGELAQYALRKYDLFTALVEAVSPFWEQLSSVGNDFHSLTKASCT